MRIIKKKMVKANLNDYNKTYKRFKWKDVYNEIEWFGKNKLNIAHNVIDRHSKTWRKNKVALCWEGYSGETKKYTFFELKKLTNQFANVLKKYKIKKGDRIFIFLPRIPELYISFIGILKMGGIAATLFAAFGPAALKDRLKDSGAKVIITNSQLKKRIYKIKKDLPELKHVIVVDKPNKKGEIDYQKEMEKALSNFNVKEMKLDDYAFMLYTSGTTGKPKGVVHTHRAVLQEHISAKWVLDIRDNDTYWCTADPGWVTGIAYGIIGSWSNGVTSIVYEGRFSPEKWYSIIEKYKVNIWYTAPTAIRMLMKAGNSLVKKYDLSSLRHLCSVGEPLNPEAIKWGLKVFKLGFHDNWWQTETGSILIANYSCLNIKIGSMGKPFPGVRAAIVDKGFNELGPGKMGNLAIKPGWPSMMKVIWKNKKRYKSYFKKSWYITGDKAYKDKDGYFWFVGRGDDVIKTSGERVGPFEVESALVEHPAIVEAGVIGKPDSLRGEIIKAFVILGKGYKASDKLKKDIQHFVKRHLAGHEYPREIKFVSSLPKTRSGKIMRRLLKARELNLPTGDTSTLEEY